jgi:hypothetical protein
MNRSRYVLAGALLPLVMLSPAFAGAACTTDYCIRSQTLSYHTPAEWPAVPVASCCKTTWGSLPDTVNWSGGVPVMICTGKEDYASAFPNCGDPNNLSLPYPLDYDEPKISIGVAWPSSKNYRYEMESVPIVDGSDGTCARYSSQPGKVAKWWVHELREPKRGSYAFTATVSFRRGEEGYYAVLNECKLAPPS